MIELQHLTKRFATQGGTVIALNDINLTIRDGDVYGIIGMSGAGKSTLVRCINLLERPQSGKVIVAGAVVNACLNFLLIPHFAALGAAAASVAAECFITSLYLWLGRDFIKLKMLVRYGWKRLVAAVVMLGAVVWTGQFLEQVRGLGPITTFIQIGAGAMVYFLVLLVMRDPFLYQYLGKIYRRLTGQP